VTAACSFCGCPLVRPESKALRACAECRLCIANAPVAGRPWHTQRPS
jgi:hypothetical protein